MPLPPLPDNNTARYFVDYTSNQRAHTLMVRYLEPTPNSPPSTPFVARLATVLADIAAWLPTDFAVIGARYSPRLSTVSLPATPPAGPTGTGPAQLYDVPAYAAFVGRSPGGRKFRLFVLGVAQTASDGGAGANYRLTTAEGAVAATVVANLQGWANLGGTDGLYSIDGVPGTDIYNYVNLGYNAYWQRKARA